MNKYFISILILAFQNFYSQENLDYQKPPKEILELADFQRPPSVIFNSKKTTMLFAYRDTYKSLEDLSEKDMKLAGLRLNPITRIASTMVFINDLKIQNINESNQDVIKNLPKSPKIAYITWSPNEDKIAFVNATNTQLELWLIDVSKKNAKKLTTNTLNAATGNPITWLNNNEMLINVLPANTSSYLLENFKITGPTTSESKGQVSQNRTYQDLLKNPQDEQNFKTLITSEIIKINTNGKSTIFLPKNLYTNISVSPNNQYIMVENLTAPFSYIVPYNRFPQEINVYNANAKLIKKVHQQGLLEIMPKGFMATTKEKRAWEWRTDEASTLSYVIALDEGDPATKVDFRDEVFSWEAPFDKTPVSLLKTKLRYRNIDWANNNIAILTESWYDTRQEITSLVDPANKSIKQLWERNSQDQYSNPGNFIKQKNKFGAYVLRIENNSLLLNGNGYTSKGQYPFIDELNLESLKKNRIYTSKYTDKKEDIISILDYKNKTAIVMLQSAKEYPNYFIKNLTKNTESKITDFKNPFTELNSVEKQVITYKRADGIELSGTLFLPKNAKKDKALPLLIWAYPIEFKDKNSAGQVTKNSNQFTFPSYGSFIYWVNKGYVVLDDASFPILGEGKQEPNDTFITQLVSNAQAAIDAVDQLGYINTKKVAIGGHSYGAFMTANLLTHSKLFACGIARSGAYNRTLTPFGFQSEQRNYWDIKDVYNTMSPFMNAEKMKTPLLLVHGEADNNPGTFTLQTERYFQALKGLGAPVRMVILPKESHGYVAKENIFHLLWEQDEFLTKCFK